MLPLLAYWYEGGRPSGCCPPCGFIKSELVDAAGFVGCGVAEACDAEAEVVEAAEVATPLVLAAAAVLVGVERLEVERLSDCECTDWLEDLLVEPTSFLNIAGKHCSRCSPVSPPSSST